MPGAGGDVGQRLARAAVAIAVAGAAWVAGAGGVLANGADIHLGGLATGMPQGVSLGVLGFVGAVVAMFLFNWARYRRRARGGGRAPGRRSGAARREGSDDARG